MKYRVSITQSYDVEVDAGSPHDAQLKAVTAVDKKDGSAPVQHVRTKVEQIEHIKEV